MPGLIGSDPELIILANNNRVRAATFFPDVHGTIGRDGNGYPLELRPPPSPTVERHITEIKRCYAQLQDNLRCFPYFQDKEVRIIAGAYHTGCAIGGHIHLDAQSNVENRGNYIGSFIYGFNYLTARQDAFMRRSGSSYGEPADIRSKQHGSGMHGFEIRSPDSWLVTPMWTGAYLSIAWLLNENFDYMMEHSKDFTPFAASMFHEKPLHCNNPSEAEKDTNRTRFLSVMDCLRGFDEYKSVKSYIDFAYDHVNREQTCPTWMNTLNTWGLGNKNSMSVDFMKEEIWQEIKGSLNIPKNIGSILFYSILSKDRTVWLNGDMKVVISVAKELRKLGLNVGIGKLKTLPGYYMDRGLFVGMPSQIRRKRSAINVCQTIIDTVSTVNKNERMW